jgi:hypothetical protein
MSSSYGKFDRFFDIADSILCWTGERNAGEMYLEFLLLFGIPITSTYVAALD